ncbi:MAG: A/G-specific adenine glycosylase [Lachnospiraceae bacterium]|nr:A/G-specific adenine glycosylase [Lachnospiraceae bacterium]
MLEKIVQPLMMWYDKNKRQLPWREKKNPYEIWVSEIMLQQTRVEAVKPFFLRFTDALPDVHALAVCPEDQLLKLWEGLGYYNRVRNMQKAAIRTEEEFQGTLPADYKALKSLPGIGSYTAGAIASIAYDIPVPAVDGNVLRVLARIRDDDRDILKQSLKNQVEEELLAVMPSTKPGEFNQALMELGATVCAPNGAPHCECCPLSELCLARKRGHEMDLPVKKKAKERRIEKHTILVIIEGSRIAIQRRPAKGLLAGMYEFPNLEGYLSKEEVLQHVEQQQLIPQSIQKLPRSRHVFSHVEWHMDGYLISVTSRESQQGKPDGDLIFADLETAQEQYAIPAAYAAYARYLNLFLGQERYEVKE